MHFSAALFHLLALLWTLLVEGTGMAIWARIAYPQPWRALLCSILVNLVVHSLFWYSQPAFTSYWPITLYLAELLVVLVEGAIYARVLAISRVTAWLLSTFLNLTSFLTGIWLWQQLL